MVRSLVTDIPGHNEERGGAAAGGVSRAAPGLGSRGGPQDSAGNDPSAMFSQSQRRTLLGP